MTTIGYLFISSAVCLLSIVAYFSYRWTRKAFKIERNLKSSFLKKLGIFLVSCALTLVIFYSTVKTVNVFFVEWYRVHFFGMSPNLRERDHFFVKRFNLDFKRADIVTYRSRSDGEIHFSRILALPGESISLKGGIPFVNGKILDETSYVVTGKLRFDEDPIQLGTDEFFVLEDYREDMFTMTRSNHVIRESAITGEYWYTWYRSSGR